MLLLHNVETFPIFICIADHWNNLLLTLKCCGHHVYGLMLLLVVASPVGASVVPVSGDPVMGDQTGGSGWESGLLRLGCRLSAPDIRLCTHGELTTSALSIHTWPCICIGYTISMASI